jgi:hypothetical protein
MMSFPSRTDYLAVVQHATASAIVDQLDGPRRMTKTEPPTFS